MGAPFCLDDDDDNPFGIAQLTSYTLTTCFCAASCDQWSSDATLDRSKYSINLDSAMDALRRGFTPGTVPACFSWVYGSQCCFCALSWVCVGLGLERGVYDVLL